MCGVNLGILHLTPINAMFNHIIKSIPFSRYLFPMGKQNSIKIVESCTYLGIIMDAYVNFKSCINTLAQSRTRALRVLIHNNKLVD